MPPPPIVWLPVPHMSDMSCSFNFSDSSGGPILFVAQARSGTPDSFQNPRLPPATVISLINSRKHLPTSLLHPLSGCDANHTTSRHFTLAGTDFSSIFHFKSAKTDGGV